MFQVYLTSVIIYTIIILCIEYIFGEGIKNNHWLDGTKKGHKSGLVTVVATSAIPIVRLFVVCVLIYMASHTKEDFDKWYAKIKAEAEGN